MCRKFAEILGKPFNNLLRRFMDLGKQFLLLSDLCFLFLRLAVLQFYFYFANYPCKAFFFIAQRTTPHFKQQKKCNSPSGCFEFRSQALHHAHQVRHTVGSTSCTECIGLPQNIRRVI